jgi:hypothetical protein
VCTTRSTYAEFHVSDGSRNYWLTRAVEIGTGSGRDPVEFMKVGIHVSGIDLSVEHVRMAHAVGVNATQASMFWSSLCAQIIRPWLDDEHARPRPGFSIRRGLYEITSVLQDGAPPAVGWWDGVDVLRWRLPLKPAKHVKKHSW